MSSYTVENWINYWLDTFQSIKLKASCMDSYMSILRVRIAPYIGHILLTDLQAEDIQKMYLSLQKRGLSAKSIINTHRLLHKALHYACISGHILHNPCDLAVLPTYNRPIMRVLSQTEQKLFCNAIGNSRYKFLFELTLQTGLRLGEVMGLCWSDVDFANRKLTVNHTLKRVSSRSGNKKTVLTFCKPKTGNSLREIPMTDFVYINLQEMYANRPDTTDQVFCTKFGTLNDPRRIQQAFSAIIKKLGFKDVTFHTLRHTFATRCLEAGIPIKTVSSILGHSTVQITMDLYQHVSFDTKKLALMKLADFCAV